MSLSNFLSIVITITNLVQTNDLRQTSKDARIGGDIILGGLFSIHMYNSKQCGRINPQRGVQRAEAMLFTLDEINDNPDLLPGIELGAVIRDTCSISSIALKQALEFVRGVNNNKQCEGGESTNEFTMDRSHKPIGVVGSSLSSITITIANLLGLFELPQISYASTSPVLSEKDLHPFFARTVPSDISQAEALAKLVQRFGWNYVSTVTGSGDYGDAGMLEFFKAAKLLGICIAVREVIKPNPTKAALDKIVSNLRGDKAKVVVVFATVDQTKLLLDAVSRADLHNHFVWIASDGWGRESTPVQGNERVANGALTVEIQSKPIDKFGDYFLDLGLDNSRDPWFEEYWEEVFKCRIESRRRRSLSDGGPHPSNFTHNRRDRLDVCTNTHIKLRDHLGTNFKQEAKIQFVYDAVYAFANTLHNLQAELCEGDPKSPLWNKEACVRKLLEYKGKAFFDKIINTSFTDPNGNRVEFTDKGDGVGQYSIFNYARQSSGHSYTYRHVGDYKHGVLTMHREPVWPGGMQNGTPVSQCSDDCSLGYIRRYDNQQQCCWSCELCGGNHYIPNITTCESCPENHWPTANKTSCFPLELHHIDFDTWYAIVPIVFSSFGILVTIAIIVSWRIYSETPLIRATGRELAYVQLAGCLVCYVVPFVLIIHPTTLTCTLQRLLIGLGFAMMYASLLTKTNRIARIFDAAKRTTKRPVYTSPRSQLMIVSSLISLQLALSAIWFGFETPGTRIETLKPDYLVLKCEMTYKNFLISQAYNVVLIIVCTAYAVKTRQIPENFNESKFIGFAMYTTCIIWLAFLPLYYVTVQKPMIQIATLCISIELSATVILSCLFLPKIYLIYFRPEKNVRRLTMHQNRWSGGGMNAATNDLKRSVLASARLSTAYSTTNTSSTTKTDEHVNATLESVGVDFDDRRRSSALNVAKRFSSDLPVHPVQTTVAPIGVKNKPSPAFTQADMTILPRTSSNTSATIITTTTTNTGSIGRSSPSIASSCTNNHSNDYSTHRQQHQLPFPTPLLLDRISQHLPHPACCDEEVDEFPSWSRRGTIVAKSPPPPPQSTSSLTSATERSTTSSCPYDCCSCSVGGTTTCAEQRSDAYDDDECYTNSHVDSSDLPSGSESLSSSLLFTQMRPPNRVSSSTSNRHKSGEADYSKQTVTAL